MSSADRLPSFVVIGAMKAGTTSLHRYLDAHHDVFMAAPKELDFFVEELNWRRGAGWYRERFAPAPRSAVALGEASTSYTKAPRYDGVPARAARVIPDARFVYVIRDPVERIRSHYEHNRVLGEERDPLDVAIRRNPAYLDYSRYGAQLGRWLECYPPDRFLVVTAEALRRARRATVASVLSFIGVDPGAPLPGLELEHYRTDDRPPYPWPVTLARNVLRRLVPNRPGLWRGSFLPERLKRTLAPHRPAARVDVPPELEAAIRDELADDVAALRPFLPFLPDGPDGPDGPEGSDGSYGSRSTDAA
jgi:Sulfotransferase domain